ncbi:MAG: hypothetical protein C0467_21005 [Planctomycetaceae bacterium]|nr:hypothetical protein [Planctomycetaceae bacterium]
MTHTPPNPFGRFHLVRPIGEGGMAVVYEAEDTRLGCQLALKLSHAAEDSAIERFYREARFAQRLHHPYVCPVYECGEINGQHYLTMPLIEGTNLDKRTGLAQTWPEKDAIELIRRLALALQSVHDAGVIHRDLKPHNVMLRPSGEPVLMDFGLARDRTGHERPLTAPGTALGTLAFIAPEQAHGNHDELCPATDVYSLGVMLYLLLTGRVPFDAPNPLTLYDRIVNEQPARPGNFRPGLSQRLEDIILCALAKSPADRFESMDSLATILAACRPAASPPPAPPPASNSEQCDVPGTWMTRPTDNPEAPWAKAATTPGRVAPRPGFVYRLVVDAGAADRQLETLTPRADLEGIDLGRCESITSGGLAAVGKLTGLRELSLTRGGVGGVPLTDAGFAALGALKRLERLEATMSGVTDAGFAVVAKFLALASAELYDCGRISDIGIANLARLTALSRLTLGGCGVTDLGLRRLGSLPNLSELTLEDCHRVTGTGLAFLNRPRGLRSLTLSGGRGIGDESLAHAANLPALERLEIRNCSRLTGSGFSHLASATRLCSLVLTACRNLTDSGLAHLEKFTKLEQVDIVGCERVTASAVERLRRALPACSVNHRVS